MSDVEIARLVVVFVVLQRLFELVIARVNTTRLLREGAKEYAPGHYPLIVAFHTLWLAGLLWAVTWGQVDIRLSMPLLGFFVLLQLGRVWVLWTLGRLWTTRIIRPRHAPLVTAGPFRWVKHPNYLIVALEIFTLPLAFGLFKFALVAGILHLGVLAIRIRAEDDALKSHPTD